MKFLFKIFKLLYYLLLLSSYQIKRLYGKKGEKENKIKEKGLVSENLYTIQESEKNLIVPQKNKLKNLYMVQ